MAELVGAVVVIAVVALMVVGIAALVKDARSRWRSRQGGHEDLFVPLGPTGGGAAPPPASPWPAPPPVPSPKAAKTGDATFAPALGGPVRGVVCFVTGQAVDICTCPDCTGWRKKYGT